ncbi:MAG: hypothetical protein AB7U82_18050 [Blastocatellales bacterium]
MPTTIPPIIPVIKPNAGGTPDAMAIPMDKGSATRKTTIDARKSLIKVARKFDSLFDSLIELRRVITSSENLSVPIASNVPGFTDLALIEAGHAGSDAYPGQSLLFRDAAKRQLRTQMLLKKPVVDPSPTGATKEMGNLRADFQNVDWVGFSELVRE